MNYNIDSLLKDYLENAIIHGEATLEGDYKRGNKAIKKLAKIFKLMEQDNHLASEMLKILMFDQNTNVRILSSAQALGLNLYTDDAIQILEKIRQTDSSILGLDADMALKNYKKDGYMKSTNK